MRFPPYRLGTLNELEIEKFFERREERHPRRQRGGRNEVRRKGTPAAANEARIWCDGSHDPRRGGSAWGVVVLLPNGDTMEGAGCFGLLRSAVEAEVMAVTMAVRLVESALPMVVFTDCRSIADAARTGVSLRVPGFSLLMEEIARRAAPVRIEWRRRKSSCQMVAAHHLANAARLISAFASAPEDGSGHGARPQARAGRSPRLHFFTSDAEEVGFLVPGLAA